LRYYLRGELPSRRSDSNELDGLLTRWEQQGILDWRALQLHHRLIEYSFPLWGKQRAPTSTVTEVQYLLEEYSPQSLREWKTKYHVLGTFLSQWEGFGVTLPGDTLAKWQNSIDRWDPELLWDQRARYPYFDKALIMWESRGLKIPPRRNSSSKVRSLRSD
jgi:hypothetical protein